MQESQNICVPQLFGVIILGQAGMGKLQSLAASDHPSNFCSLLITLQNWHEFLKEFQFLDLIYHCKDGAYMTTMLGITLLLHPVCNPCSPHLE